MFTSKSATPVGKVKGLEVFVVREKYSVAMFLRRSYQENGDGKGIRNRQ